LPLRWQISVQQQAGGKSTMRACSWISAREWGTVFHDSVSDGTACGVSVW
jgi:hypothetical protein